nr:peptidase dimerization domain-containing protein [Natronobeatus ordinarius]
MPDAAIIPEPFRLPNVGIASAGVMFFDLTIPGKKAHAAWGHQGVSALEKACLVVEALDELNAQRQPTIDFPPAYGADPSLEGHVTNINLDERFYQRYYDVPVVTTGPYGPNLHGVDEYTTVTSLLETAQTLACSVIDYCGLAE